MNEVTQSWAFCRGEIFLDLEFHHARQARLDENAREYSPSPAI
jgi:hypothetical protein